MKKAYICSPYRGDIEGNTEKAKKYSWRTMLEGFIPITPHLYFGSFLNESNVCDRWRGIEMGRELLRECSEVRVCADEVTEGMIDEISLARELKIPLKFYNVDMEIIKYDSLIINHRIGPGYRQIIEDEYNPGNKNRICPFQVYARGFLRKEQNHDHITSD